MRVLSMEKLTELATPTNPLFIEPSQHLRIMQHALAYVGKKQRRKRKEKDSSFTATRHQLFAAAQPLLGARSIYSSAQKVALRKAVKQAQSRFKPGSLMSRLLVR